ncbi:MAG: alpha/beta fold hydrolase [Sphingobium sp.]
MARNYVFLHGGGQGSWVWNDLMDALRIQHPEGVGRLLALDVPGCGTKRDRETCDMDVPTIVAELIDDIEEAGLEEAVLVGHSQAGTILPLMVRSHPRLFSHIVYLSCLAPTGAQTALNWREDMPGSSLLVQGPPVGTRERYEALFCNDMTVAETRLFLDKLGQDAWPSSSYALSGWDYDHLQHVPSTYVLCLKDQALLPGWQEIFAERLKVDEVIRVDAGHQVMNRHPHAVAELLRLIR